MAMCGFSGLAAPQGFSMLALWIPILLTTGVIILAVLLVIIYRTMNRREKEKTWKRK